jgi:hypothetical protein
VDYRNGKDYSTAFFQWHIRTKEGEKNQKQMVWEDVQEQDG